MIKKYRSKPVEAVKWDGDNFDEIISFVSKEYVRDSWNRDGTIKSLEIYDRSNGGWSSVNINYFIIRVEDSYCVYSPKYFDYFDECFDVEYENSSKNSGLLDINGKEIKIGDTVKFFESENCVWSGVVTFEDGCFTVSILDCKQIKNPDDWKQTHDWVSSRYWATTVGYGEFGTWDCPRRPLTKIARNFKDYETVKVLYDKYGYGKRILNCEILIGDDSVLGSKLKPTPDPTDGRRLRDKG